MLLFLSLLINLMHLIWIAVCISLKIYIINPNILNGIMYICNVKLNEYICIIYIINNNILLSNKTELN